MSRLSRATTRVLLGPARLHRSAAHFTRSAEDDDYLASLLIGFGNGRQPLQQEVKGGGRRWRKLRGCNWHQNVLRA